MNRILLITLLTFQIANCQVKQTREVKDLFVSSLNIPYNTRNMVFATKEYAKRNSIKQITFLIGDSIVGFNNYDKNGNLIEYTLNKHKTIYEYDDEERLILRKNFNNLTEFSDGYIFEYTENSKLTYRLKEQKILKNKFTVLENQNIETFTEYLENGEIKSRRIEVFDESDKLISESQFYKHNQYGKTQRYTIFYIQEEIPHEKMFLHVENGEQLSPEIITRQNYIYDEKGNRIKRMFEGFINCEYSYNSKNRITNLTYTTKQNGIWKTVDYKYKNDTILKNLLEINLIKETRKNIEYIYNSEKELKTIIRTNGEYIDIFNYMYDYY